MQGLLEHAPIAVAHLTLLPRVAWITRAFLALGKRFTANVRGVQLVPIATAPSVPNIDTDRHFCKWIFVNFEQLGVCQNLLDLGSHVPDIRRRQKRRCGHHPHRHVSNRLLVVEACSPGGAFPAWNIPDQHLV